MKGNEILFDIQEITETINHLTNEQQKRLYWRKYQCNKLAEIIEKEIGIRIGYSGGMELLELEYIIDRENNPIDLLEFFNKYDNEEKIINLIKTNDKIIRNELDKRSIYTNSTTCFKRR